jgi:uncharacterized membrane protein
MKKGGWFLVGVFFGVVGTLLTIAFRQYKKKMKSNSEEEIFGV